MNPQPTVLPWAITLVIAALGCTDHAETSPKVLRLATTTSTRDSGLLDVLLPPFEEEQKVRVDVVAVGTGKALKLGAAGDADLVLVHSRTAEDEFMASGFGIRREDIMHNYFEILGPPDDPAEIAGVDPAKALEQIAATGSRFVSRSDDSGTHQRELALWKSRGERPIWPEYIETGQGMGNSLVIADQLWAYVLCDRGTYLQFRSKIDLVPLVSNAPSLENPYGAIVVNPDLHRAVKTNLAQKLLDYLIADSTQLAIDKFRLSEEQLFHPAHLVE